MNRKIELALTFSFVILLVVAFIQDAFAVGTVSISNVSLKLRIDAKHTDGSTTELTQHIAARYPNYNIFLQQDQVKPIQSVRFTWELHDGNPDFTLTSIGAPSIQAGDSFVVLGKTQWGARDNWDVVGDKTMVTSQEESTTIYRLYTVEYTMAQLLRNLSPNDNLGAYKVYSITMGPLDTSYANYRGQSIAVWFESDKIVMNLFDDGKVVTTPPNEPPVVIEPAPQEPNPIPGQDPIPDSGPIVCTFDCNTEAASYAMIGAIAVVGLFSAFAYTKIVKPRR